MTEAMLLSLNVNELFAIQLFENPAQALAWTEKNIESVTLAKKPGTAEHIARLKLSLASSDEESATFATLTVVRLIEAQAAWLQGKMFWSAIGRSEALKEVVAAIRDSLTSAEEHEAIKASFLSEHRKVLDQIEQSRPNAEVVSKILADPAFRDWVNTQFKKDWNRALVARCGHDVERWVLVAPNSLKIMASSLRDLRRQYDAKLLRPPESRQKVKNPGSAARRDPRTPKA